MVPIASLCFAPYVNTYKRFQPGSWAYRGNAYEAPTDVPRMPASLVDAIAAFDSSDIAAAAFGSDVRAHLLHTARQEWAASNQVVTDWELERGFERL